jgi:hypothetical protein
MTDKRVDIDPQDTKHKGVAGLYELALRRFKTVVYIATIVPLYCLCRRYRLSARARSHTLSKCR